MRDFEELRRRRDALIAADGPWTAVDLELAPGLRTSEIPKRADDPRLDFVTQATLDLLGPDRARARVLDIGCLEGMFSLELARHGVNVVGVDVREANIKKAALAAEALGLDNARFEVGDARALPVERIGTFDVVLCLGVLYHLDGQAVPELVRTVGALATRAAIFDTHVGFGRATQVEHAGQSFWGESYAERRADESRDEHAARPWASVDNETSFWPTKRSLFRMVADSGFTTILEAGVPSPAVDRVQVVALKGRRAALRTAPPQPPMATRFPELSVGEWRRLYHVVRVRAFPRLPRWTRDALRRVKESL